MRMVDGHHRAAAERSTVGVLDLTKRNGRVLERDVSSIQVAR